MNHEIKNVISGLTPVTKSDSILSALNYLRTSKNASSIVKEPELLNKENEAKLLINHFLAPENELNTDSYLTEGAEQQVYLHLDGKFVLKTNDAIFYETWEDYLISLLLHNYFFPATSYELLGFLKKGENVYALVKQPFVFIDNVTDLDEVHQFMNDNGFTVTRNNDYFNTDLQVIIEDLHDENVVVSKGVLFFIDTVIYLKK